MLTSIRKTPMFKYLMLLVITSAAGHQGWRTLFNNFAVDVVGINGFEMGVIQSVREIPGFLTFLVIYILIIIKEHRLSALGILLLGVGICMTGLLPSFEGLLLSIFIMSVGFHYFETTNQSLTLQYFTTEEAPIVMGRLKSLGALANILTGVVVWFIAAYLSMKNTFLIVGFCVIASALYALTRNPVKGDMPIQKKKIIIRKKYWLYYVLSFFSGARRQIFVVFAVFMLVQKYEFSVRDVTILFIVNNIMTYFITPYIAKGINKFGERKMLTIEYVSLILVFAGYAFIENPILVAILYVLDHIFFGFAIGINTFLQKIADPKDVAPSISTGFAINHISAVVIPIFGGLLWMYNWRIPFITGMFFAIVSLYFVQKIPAKK